MAHDFTTNFTNGVTRQRVASICLALGWSSANASAMEVLQDLLVRYIRQIGKDLMLKAELCNRTEPNLYDLQRVLGDRQIDISDLREYAKIFNSKTLVVDPVPPIPAPPPMGTDLNFLKPGSREVLHRPVYVHDYLPPMYPELENEPDESQNVNGDLSISAGDLLPVSTVPAETMSAPIITETEANPLREIASVMMTSSGFISPARVGRLPDSRTPVVSGLVAQKLLEEEEPDDEDEEDELPEPPRTPPQTDREPSAEVVLTPADIRRKKKQELLEKRGAKRRLREEKKRQKEEEKLKKIQKRLEKKQMAEKMKAMKKQLRIQRQQQLQKQQRQLLKDTFSSGSESEDEISSASKLSVFQKKPVATAASAAKKTKDDEKKAKTTDVIRPAAESTFTDLTQQDDEVEEGEILDDVRPKTPDVPIQPVAPTPVQQKSAPKAAAQSTLGKKKERKRRKQIESALTPAIVEDRDSSPERDYSPKPKKLKPEPPIEINIPSTPVAVATSDPGLLSNPLIPRTFYGFDLPPDVEPKVESPPPLRESSPEVEKKKKKEKDSDRKSEEKHEKKEKSNKKSKKEKKDKHDKERRDKDKDKEKREKEKKKKKIKERERPISPPLFEPTKPTPSLPKLKIKDFKPDEEAKSPKLVFKSSEPPKVHHRDPPKDVDMFSDPVKIERPQSSASSYDKKSESKKSESKKPEQKKTKKVRESKKEESVKKEHRSSKREKPSRVLAESGSENEDLGDVGEACVTAETVGHYIDAEGNQVWICPTCARQDDGTAMIGCDSCDDWYHWLCVGITAEPAENTDWYCPRCVIKFAKQDKKSKSGKRNKK